MTTTAQSRSDRVAILLATYNGARCLQAQLESYAAQSHPPVAILVSDDGSGDATLDLIQAFAAAHPELGLRVIDGPKRGAALNFLHLLGHAPADVDVVALSDQDDVWLPEKLARGLAHLARAQQASPAADVPLLYCGRSWECDDNLQGRRLSRGMQRPASFRHALVQNAAGGNTMMLNRAALELLQAARHEVRKLVVHDWWIYQLLMGCGGRLIFDDTPTILYRQHVSNLIGANRGWRAKYIRLRMLFNGRFRAWNTINIKALLASAHRLTPQNRALLQRFAQERNGSLWQRLRLLRSTGLYRQGLQGTLSLYVAALLRRI